MRTQDRMIVWQAWKETRRHWMIFGMALHIPAILGWLLLMAVTLIPGTGLELSASQVPAYLNMAVIGQTTYLLCIGLCLIGYVTATTVRRGLDRGDMAYLVDQPIPKGHVLRLKLLMLAGPAVVWSGLSLLTTVTLVYLGCNLLIPEATPATNWTVYRQVMANNLRGCLDLALLAGMAVTNAVLWALVLKRQGLAIGVGLCVLYALLAMMDHQTLFGIQDYTGDYGTQSWMDLAPKSILISVVITMVCMLAAHRAFQRREWQ